MRKIKTASKVETHRFWDYETENFALRAKNHIFQKNILHFLTEFEVLAQTLQSLLLE